MDVYQQQQPAVDVNKSLVLAVLPKTRYAADCQVFIVYLSFLLILCPLL